MPKETFFNLSEQKQETIIRAAIGEFSKHGFEKGNIGEIAKNAGVAKGSMYQYFMNKQELFQYSVHWALEMLTKKFNPIREESSGKTNLNDFIYQSSMRMWMQLKDEKEAVLFIEDVFLGKYGAAANDSIAEMMKVSEDYVLQIVRDGQHNGYIRKDIDETMIAHFLSGASIKMKEHMMRKAREAGVNSMNEHFFESFDREIKSILELITNGMGAK